MHGTIGNLMIRNSVSQTENLKTLVEFIVNEIKKKRTPVESVAFSKVSQFIVIQD
jgi:hypothetical protein